MNDGRVTLSVLTSDGALVQIDLPENNIFSITLQCYKSILISWIVNSNRR